MLTKSPQETWSEFLEFIGERCSATEFENWFAPIRVLEWKRDRIRLEVPNIFVQEYLLDNYKKDLRAFLPLKSSGEPAVTLSSPRPKRKPALPLQLPTMKHLRAGSRSRLPASHEMKLNPFYTFENFIEGPANQFVKSAAMGVAARPCKSYNPLFIHGGVGLGKTHLLHAIGHHIREHNKKLRVHCITTEGFINDLVDNLRNKSMDRMKRFYRSLDVLMVDDIQFLQSRLNFEEEFCNTFESLINQSKQIVITSDKPPGQLKLSERMVARMEWGLVAHIGIPDLETRVAILTAQGRTERVPHPPKSRLLHRRTHLQ